MSLIISSAHRSPERTKNYIKEAEEKGAQVFIAAAGMAAHLAGGCWPSAYHQACKLVFPNGLN